MFWSNRIALARLGWETRVEFSRNGIIPKSPTHVALGIWARRWDWQGWVSQVVFHTHDIFDVCEDDAEARVLACLETLIEGCRRAPFEFPDSVPMQIRGRSPEGLLIFGEGYLGRPSDNSQVRSVVPSEVIPPDEEIVRGASGMTPIRGLIEIAASGYDVQDRLHHAVGIPRVVRDCKDRQWGYRISLCSPIFHPGKEFGPRKWDVDSVDEASAGALLGAARSVLPPLTVPA